MHASERKVSITEACLLFGYSRQGYYKSQKGVEKRFLEDSIVLDVINDIRQEMPYIGGRKLYKMLSDRLPDELLFGRDALFELLRCYGLQIRRSRHKPFTTNSRHRFKKYPNLIQGFTPTVAGQLYVSDITYIEIKRKRFYYLSLVTDAYSRKIVGWHLSKDLKTKSCLKALRMALDDTCVKSSLIHHSDRGTQYCSNEYIKLLNRHNITISMTENGDPRENAIAERVNGILKTEWLNHMQWGNIKEAREQIANVINLYNTKRPHLSIGLLTPEMAHSCEGVLERKWKNYYRVPAGSEQPMQQCIV